MKGHIILRSTSAEIAKQKKRGKRAVYSWGIVIEQPRGPDGKRKQKWHSFKGSESGAESELRRLLHAVETGEYIEPTRMTLAEYLAKWLDHARSQVAGKTFERYSEICSKCIAPAIGGKPLLKLTPLDIQGFYAEQLANGRKVRKRKDGTVINSNPSLSPRTVLHYHRVLREALQQAVKWQLLARNPADAVEPPRVEQKEMAALDEPHAAWLLTAAEGTRLYAPTIVALTTGMRRGELFGLRWKDVDLDAGVAAVTQSLSQTNEGLHFKVPKTAKGRRRVELLPLTVEALREHRTRQDADRALFGADYEDNGLVFASPDGRPWPPDSFSSEFRKFAHKIGVKVRFHDLRHSHASQLLRQGIHPKVVSERLGHATVGITLDTYSHVLPGLQAEAAAKLDTALRAALSKQRGEKTDTKESSLQSVSSRPVV